MAVFLSVATFYAYLFFMRVYAQADFTLMRTLTPFNEVEMSVCSELFLDYCILGGMPAVVREFITKGTFEGSLDIQRQLIVDYREDIRKCAEGIDQTRILNVFDHILPSDKRRIG